MMRVLIITLVLITGVQSMAQVTTSRESAISQIKAQIMAQNCDIPEQLVAIVGQSAEERSAAAIILNDFRYMALSGETLEVPVIEFSSVLCPVQVENLQLFDADPDVARCPIHNELLTSLRTFAGQYNFYIFKARVERGMKTCAT
jgi:hypothetical protein